MRVRIPPTPVDQPHLHLRYIDENFEAYLDGQRIYRFGDLDTPKVKSGSPLHLIALGRAPQGKTLALRVHSSHAFLGVKGTPLLGPEGALLRQILRSGAAEFLLGAVLLVVALGAAVVSFAVRSVTGSSAVTTANSSARGIAMQA
jgi:hypothetical protein